MNELTFDKAPKILSWLAHKADIDSDRAEILWHAALRYADHTCTPNTSEYWQAALDRLYILLAVEAQRADLASFGWRPWARNLAELLALRVSVFDEIVLASMRSWRVISQPRLLH
jgi:hypothetical protein